MPFEHKYLKYKQKYLELKKEQLKNLQVGGAAALSNSQILQPINKDQLKTNTFYVYINIKNIEEDKANIFFTYKYQNRDNFFTFSREDNYESRMSDEYLGRAGVLTLQSEHLFIFQIDDSLSNSRSDRFLQTMEYFDKNKDEIIKKKNDIVDGLRRNVELCILNLNSENQTTQTNSSRQNQKNSSQQKSAEPQREPPRQPLTAAQIERIRNRVFYRKQRNPDYKIGKDNNMHFVYIILRSKEVGYLKRNGNVTWIDNGDQKLRDAGHDPYEIALKGLDTF